MTPVALTLLLLAEPQAPSFPAEVEVVRLDVAVTREGRPVSGLGPASFEVREDGVLQQIQSARWGEEPIELVLALDTSGSVAGPRIERLKAAAGSLFAQLRPQDCVRILTFASGVRFAPGECLDAGSAGAAIQAAVGMGGTRLHDGLYASLALAGGQKGLPIVVALTDGQDTSSWLSSDAVLLAAKALPATVHVVVAVDSRGFRFSTPDWHERPATTEGGLALVVRGGTPPFLERIASETGGRVFPAAAEDLQEAFGRVLQEIRGRYVLRYEPSGVPRPGWHRLEVKLKGVRGDVLARRGYLATTGARPAP